MSEFTEKTAPGLIEMFEEGKHICESNAESLSLKSYLHASFALVGGAGTIGLTALLQYYTPQQVHPALLSIGYVVGSSVFTLDAYRWKQFRQASNNAYKKAREFDKSISILETLVKKELAQEAQRYDDDF